MFKGYIVKNRMGPVIMPHRVYPLCIQISTNAPLTMATATQMQSASTQSAATSATVNSATMDMGIVTAKVKDRLLASTSF